MEPGSESIPPLSGSVAQFTANFRSGVVRKYISSTLEAGVGEFRFVDQQSLDVPSILYLKVLTKVKLSSGKILIGEYCEYIF